MGAVNKTQIVTDFEFPTSDYIQGLSQKRSLKISGASVSTDANLRCNILLSNGEQSKVGDWQNQTVTMVEGG
jgi:hypothetical protein